MSEIFGGPYGRDSPLLLRDWCGNRAQFFDREYLCCYRQEHDGPHGGWTTNPSGGDWLEWGETYE
jgi:hypothetical protein